MALRRALGVLVLCFLVAGLAPRGASPVAAAAELLPGGGAVVVADELNVRGGPGRHNPAVAVLPAGTNVRLLAGPLNDVWWRVAAGERVGYVNGEWLAPAELTPAGPVFDLDLPIPFHRQLTAVWCDPADVQSWVEYDLGQSLGDSYAIQQRIWDWELGHNAGFTVEQWNASPFAVASAVQNWLPDRGINHFIYDDPAAATATVAWVLANPQYREPAIALIWRGDHYVLVRGVRATADPFQDPAQAKILGVYVMDPNQGSPSWLGEDRYIPLAEWLGQHLTSVSYLTPHTGVPGDVWQDKYVLIQRDWTDEGPTLPGRLNASPDSYLAGE